MKPLSVCVLMALVLCGSASLGAEEAAAPEPGPPLPESALDKLAEVAKQGVGPDQISALRKELTKALADIYKAEAAQGTASWPSGSLEGFWGWLEKQDALYGELILAIQPRDSVASVFGVVDRLRAKFPQEVAKWPHLVIAYAVVWDDPEAPARTREAILWGEQRENVGEPPGLEESFKFLAGSQSKLTYRAEQQRWPFLVYVADNDASIEDRKWALRQYARQAGDLGPVYSAVPYDMDKVNRLPAKIGKHPTTLPNLLHYGGVCADQAYFAARVCKTFGVPAAAVSGTASYGFCHAWIGYFGVTTAAGHARPDFKFHGRYLGDHYYVGTVLDPQTLTPVSDRDLALLFDGAAQYADYERARLLWRVARWLDARDEKLAARLLVASAQSNCYFGPAWRGIADKVAAGVIPKPDGGTLLKTMLARLQRHPDLTLSALERFLAAVPESDVDTRNAYYNQAFRLYAARPDLQARLRLAQGNYLKEHGRAAEALRLMGATALANAVEAIHILPLAHGALDLYRERKWWSKGIAFAEALLAKIPKARMERPSPVYLEFCEDTAKFCEDAGSSDRAAKWRAEATKTRGH